MVYLNNELTSHMVKSQDDKTPTDPRSEMSWLRRFVDKGEDPPMLFFLLIACLFLGSGYALTTIHNDQFEENIGSVVEKNADWEFVEKDAGGCDHEGNNCNKRTSIHCLADLVVQHNWKGDNYTSQVNNWFVYSEWDYSDAKQSCEEFVKNSTLEIGSNVTIFFDKEDPSVAYEEMPETWFITIYWFGIFLSGFWVLGAIIFVLEKLGGSKKQQLSEWEKVLKEHDDKNKRE